MSDKLCPFCGGSECYSVDDYGDVSVACLYKTHGDTWNTRPLEDAANARAEAAEAKVAALQAALQAANEDAARLASVLANGGLKRQAIALHRARVGAS